MRGGQKNRMVRERFHFTVTEAGEREYLSATTAKTYPISASVRAVLQEDSGMKFGDWLRSKPYKREVAW